MKIDGKAIAQSIFDDLTKRVTALKDNGIIPHLVIILIGNDPASETYVRQKVLKGESVGIKVELRQFPNTISQQKLLSVIEQLNNDNNVHGIIVQRPLPDQVDTESIDNAVKPQKDVDGFHPDSPFQMPLAAAVLRILEDIFTRSHLAKQGETLKKWLMAKKIVVMGKGKTGGGPIISALAKLGVKPPIVDSKTGNPVKITKTADIIICAIGKPNMITKNMIKKGVILIAVGMHKGEDGKMHGDYNEEDIKDIVSYYTPVPGGVGPVNVAMLLENVVTACEHVTS